MALCQKQGREIMIIIFVGIQEMALLDSVVKTNSSHPKKFCFCQLRVKYAYFQSYGHLKWSSCFKIEILDTKN